MQQFTPEQEAAIDALRAAGVGERKIAAALGVTHWAIREDRKNRQPKETK